jgi:PAS domain S-box-containing protein
VDGDAHSVLEVLLQSSPDAVIVVDPAGVIETASPAVSSLFGYTPEELVGQPVEVLVPERFRQAHVHDRHRYSQQAQPRPMGANLDLHGRRRDGSVFPVDISLAPALVDGGLHVGAFIRDATERRRSETLLRHVNEISRLALAGSESTELFKLTAERARELLGAVTAWVAIRGSGDDENVVVIAASGRGAKELAGALVATTTSIAAKVMQQGTVISVPDMSSEPDVIIEAQAAGLGPGLYLPMLAEDGAVGALVIARGAAERPFDMAEMATAETFASAAAVVVALDQARQSIDELKMMAEHERIARDLHDTVIQRLFAVGMGLSATERLADPKVGDRIGEAVDALDDVIRDIRETIFDLGRPSAVGSRVHQAVREVIGEAKKQLGFSPRLAFRGPVEAAISDQILPHLVAVLRESLSNVARHANASAVDVVVQTGSRTASVVVSDNGVGIADLASAGHGLENMKSRAEQLGGEFSLDPRLPTGTLLLWSVPV